MVVYVAPPSMSIASIAILFKDLIIAILSSYGEDLLSKVSIGETDISTLPRDRSGWPTANSIFNEPLLPVDNAASNSSLDNIKDTILRSRRIDIIFMLSQQLLP